MITRVVVKEVLRKTCNVCGAAHPEDDPSDRPIEEVHAALVADGWSVLQPDQGEHSFMASPSGRWARRALRAPRRARVRAIR